MGGIRADLRLVKLLKRKVEWVEIEISRALI